MIPKEFDSIGKEDIEALVANAVSEGRAIEYKEQLPGGADDDKREFLADASSFANAGGGDLIFGVRDKRDASGKPTGIPETAVGLTGTNADAEMRRLEAMLRAGVDPRIPAIRIKHIDGFPSGPVILLRVPKSWVSPHMVIFKNLSRFFSRTSAGRHQLDVREIRTRFTASESLYEKIRRFRDDRLAKIIADETPVKLQPNAKIIIHLIPIAFSDPSARLDVTRLNEMRQLVPPLHASAWDHRINFDGFLTFSHFGSGSAGYTYLQVFRSGAFEAVEADLLAERNGRKFLSIVDCEKAILLGLEKYIVALKELGASLPIIILGTIYGVEGYTLAADTPSAFFYQTHPIDRNLLLLPEVLIEDFSVPIDIALRPMFDAIWQSVGLPKSESYSPDGRWDGGASARRRSLGK
jgi:hypothetical protein